MKNKFFIFIFALGLAALAGCSNENEDNNTSYDPLDPLNGVWNLTRAVSGWNSYPEIEDGMVTFEFNTNNSTVIIINNFEENYPLPSSGAHFYEIVTFEDNDYILISGYERVFNGFSYGLFIDGDELNMYIDFGRLGRIDHSRYVIDAAIWSFGR
jgi:hypothetical protein